MVISGEPSPVDQPVRPEAPFFVLPGELARRQDRWQRDILVAQPDAEVGVPTQRPEAKRGVPIVRLPMQIEAGRRSRVDDEGILAGKRPAAPIIRREVERPRLEAEFERRGVIAPGNRSHGTEAGPGASPRAGSRSSARTGTCARSSTCSGPCARTGSCASSRSRSLCPCRFLCPFRYRSLLLSRWPCALPRFELTSISRLSFCRYPEVTLEDPRA